VKPKESASFIHEKRRQLQGEEISQRQGTPRHVLTKPRERAKRLFQRRLSYTPPEEEISHPKERKGQPYGPHYPQNVLLEKSDVGTRGGKVASSLISGKVLQRNPPWKKSKKRASIQASEPRHLNQKSSQREKGKISTRPSKGDNPLAGGQNYSRNVNSLARIQ